MKTSSSLSRVVTGKSVGWLVVVFVAFAVAVFVAVAVVVCFPPRTEYKVLVEADKASEGNNMFFSLCLASVYVLCV